MAITATPCCEPDRILSLVSRKLESALKQYDQKARLLEKERELSHRQSMEIKELKTRLANEHSARLITVKTILGKQRGWLLGTFRNMLADARDALELGYIEITDEFLELALELTDKRAAAILEDCDGPSVKRDRPCIYRVLDPKSEADDA